MKIAVFGSTGGNGRLILAEGIRRGHEVTAFARQASALAGVSGLAAILEGNATDQAKVLKAVADQEAVIMTVTASEAIARVITGAMQSLGVRRLVATSAYGLVATKPYVLAPIVRRIFARTYAGQLAADRVIQATDLDWTILRATRLTNRPSSHSSRMSSELYDRGPWSIARASFSDALLDLAESRLYIGQIVNITG